MAGTAYFIDKKVDSNGNFKENYSWCDTIGGSTVVILSQNINILLLFHLIQLYIIFYTETRTLIYLLLLIKLVKI